jgi:hypothetical protein
MDMGHLSSRFHGTLAQGVKLSRLTRVALTFKTKQGYVVGRDPVSEG